LTEVGVLTTGKQNETEYDFTVLAGQLAVSYKFYLI